MTLPSDQGTNCVVVTDLWKELLRVESVAPEDDFFQLGGDSLLAIRLLVALSKRVGRDLEYERFFASATFATLCQLVKPVEA